MMRSHQGTTDGRPSRWNSTSSPLPVVLARLMHDNCGETHLTFFCRFLRFTGNRSTQNPGVLTKADTDRLAWAAVVT
jgi:hypothetical protein